jgi:hypothetical protein
LETDDMSEHTEACEQCKNPLSMTLHTCDTAEEKNRIDCALTYDLINFIRENHIPGRHIKEFDSIVNYGRTLAAQESGVAAELDRLRASDVIQFLHACADGTMDHSSREQMASVILSKLEP